MITLTDLLSATTGVPHGLIHADTFTDFAYDSRRLQPGQLFIAVQTPTGDGHDYIPEAIQRGATGVLCQRPADYPVTTVVVANTNQALPDYARFMLQKYGLPVIGVTGSTGKTTTKEAIAAVLQTRFNVFKNFGSYNGRYGLPIALGQLAADHQIAVLEMACDSFGEIAELAALAHPQVGVVTAISPAHLAGLGSVENIALEKGRLVESLPASGTAILNADDPRVAAMAQRTRAGIITFGFNADADITVSDVIVSAGGTAFSLHHQDQNYTGRVSLLGRHQLYAVMAAVAVGLHYHIPILSALNALSGLPYLPGRLQPLAGVQGSLILDDSFNANPASMRAAIETLAAIAPRARRIAVLGQMADLGDDSLTAHRALGELLPGKVDQLVTLGEAGQVVARAAQSAGLDPDAIHITYTLADALQAVLPHLDGQSESVVLVKASAEARLERVVEKLLANPAADHLKLARAEPGWEQVRIGLPDRPTWIEVDLDAVRDNVCTLAQMAAPARLMAVLKADAYGHGAVKIARTSLSNGAGFIGVATLGEAIILRQAGLTAPILVLGYLPAWQAGDAIRNDVRATVFSHSVLQAFSNAAQRLNTIARVHLKVDTGMGRLGVLPEQAIDLVRAAQLPGVAVEGIFTHFGRADEADLDSARAQLQVFGQIIAELEALGLRPPLVHAANTAAIINLPEARFDLVRAGIGLYGLAPSADAPLPPPMRPVLSFKTTIGQVKTLPPDQPIGYGGTYVTTRQETIAIIPVGYADGFRRAPHTWGSVLVKGQRASLVGRVSMDQSAINVSHIPNVRQGDEVVLIGRQGNEQITAEEVAANLGTINYEVVSQILARVPRIS